MEVRVLCLLALLCGFLPVCVNAHTYLSSVTINGVKQTGCLRPLGTNSPISSVTSNDMMCGFLPQGAAAASMKCPIAAGSTISLQWNHNNDAPTDDIIDPSHKGPCMVYLSSDNGVSWFKIFEQGYDTTTQQFCVIELIANRGVLTATIPSDIAPGNYLLRGEIIALHQAENLNGAQPYVDCAELTITGSGTAKPAGVAFPGAYTPTDPGILFNIYASPMAKYIIPGPAVYTSSASGNTPSGGNTPSNDNGSSSMSAGGIAAITIFFIAFAGVIVYSAFYYQRKGHILGFSLAKKSQDTPVGGNYVAFVDN